MASPNPALHATLRYLLVPSYTSQKSLGGPFTLGLGLFTTAAAPAGAAVEAAPEGRTQGRTAAA